MKTYFNTCPRDCYDTCAMITTVEDGKAVRLHGNPRHPITRGFLCWKIQNALKFVYSPERLKRPLKRVGRKGTDNFREITWNEAYREIALQMENVLSRHGAEAILPFHYYGHMGLLNKQLSQRVFNALGTSNCLPTVCSNAGRTAMQYVYGGFWGIDPEKINSSKLIIFWGLNGPWSNLHGYNMVKKALRNGAKFYNIDPLKTCQHGKHLAIKPNTDGALALGIANYLITNNLYDREHVEKYTHGFEQFREVARDFSLEKVSKITDLSLEDIRELAEDLYRIRPNFIHLGFGIQKHLYGGEAARTIALLPPLVGGFRVHYSNTDREIDLGFLQGKHLINSEIQKDKKLRNMAQLGKILESGEVKFLFVFNTNPMVNLPNQALVKKGMESEDVFTVVHDLFLNDSCSYADIVLPASSFLESFDIHVSYYHNYMSINQKAIEPLGDSKPNYQVFKELSEALGLNTRELFPPVRIVAEEFLSRSRSVDFTLNDLEQDGYRKMKPRPQNQYLTPSGKIEMYSQLSEKADIPPLPGYYEEDRGEFPFQFLTANHKRITRSQFHNIWKKEIEPVVLINMEDAKEKGIKEGDWLMLKSSHDTLKMKAHPTTDIKQGVTLAYGGLWSKLCEGKGANTLIPDVVQDFGSNATYNSTYIQIEKL